MKIKSKISSVLRKLRLLSTVDLLRFNIHKIKFAEENKKFIKEHPNVVLPPDYMMYEAFQLRYKSYYYGGLMTAGWILDFCRKYKKIENLNILDWGCGPGRAVRHIPDLIDTSNNVYGTDYNLKTIEWCKKSIKNIRFSKNELAPPMNFEDDKFDIIYGISIFTHLSEDMHYKWIDELYRVLNNEGILLISTHGENFRQKLTPGEIKDFDNGKLVVRGNVKNGHRNYTAFQPNAFMKKLLEKFTVLEQVIRTSNHPDEIFQDLWIVKKK